MINKILEKFGLEIVRRDRVNNNVNNNVQNNNNSNNSIINYNNSNNNTSQADNIDLNSALLEVALNQDRLNVFAKRLEEYNIEEQLKCKPKSNYIYNGDVVCIEDLRKMNDEEKNKLILDYYNKNKSVREENEQFRQKNFLMYLELRKLKKAGV